MSDHFPISALLQINLPGVPSLPSTSRDAVCVVSCSWVGCDKDVLLHYSAMVELSIRVYTTVWSVEMIDSSSLV